MFKLMLWCDKARIMYVCIKLHVRKYVYIKNTYVIKNI